MKKTTNIKTKTKTKTKRKPAVNFHAKAAKNIKLIVAKTRMLGCLTDEMNRFLNLCLTLKISEITWDFSGSGDSGDVEDINLWTRTSKDATTVINRYGEDNKSWTSVHDELHELCRGYVFDHYISDKCDIDWYNNEGGFGTAFLDLETGSFQVEASAYERVVACSDSQESNLLECLTEKVGD